MAVGFLMPDGHAPTTLLLVPHARTEWNERGWYQGWTDIPLNDYGYQMADRLAKRLAREPIAAIYTSDLCRAIQTARPVWEAKRVPWIVKPELREFERFGDEFLVVNRLGVCYTVTNIAQDYKGQTVLVVTHSGPMRALLREIAPLRTHEFESKQCGINRLTYVAGEWELMSLDE